MATTRFFNCIASRDVEEDWKIERAQKLGYLPEKIKVPSKVDLRRSWWNVGNQGKCLEDWWYDHSWEGFVE